MVKYFLMLIFIRGMSCTSEVRNIANNTEVNSGNDLIINPVDVNDEGFDFLEKMEGHWVGSNLVITTEYPWFGWDNNLSPSAGDITHSKQMITVTPLEQGEITITNINVQN